MKQKDKLLKLKNKINEYIFCNAFHVINKKILYNKKLV